MKNSDLKLEANVRTRLEQELGSDVPDPNSPDFQSFLEELQATRPDLFDDVMRGLHVNVVLPVEAQAQRAERRETVQSNVKRAFFRRSQVDGEPVTAKRRIMAYILGGIALLLPLSYIIGQGLAGTEPATEGQIVPEVDTVLPDPATTRLEPLPAATPEPEPTPVETPLPKLPPPPREIRAEVAPPAPPRPAPPKPTPTLTAPPVQAAPAAPVEQPLPDTLGVYKTEEALPANLLSYQSEQAPNQLDVFQEEESLPASLDIDLSDSGTNNLPTTLSVAENAPTQPADETVIFDLEQVQAETKGEAGQNIDRQPAAAPTATLPAETLPDESLAAVTEDAPVESELANEDANEEIPLTEGVAGEAPEVTLFPPGTRLTAKMVTGLQLVQGAAVPIVAESSGDWCTEATCTTITWLGRATLDATERVQITLDQAVIGENLYSISGSALNRDLTFGLVANVRFESSSFAQQLLSSSLGGVSDYVQALTQRQKITVVDGVAFAEKQVPEIDAFVLGRVASLFSPPQNGGGTVRVAEVASGTPFVILYGITN